MNVTLFGFPKTGKTTLFNLLTGADIEVTSYDSGRKEPHQRTCPVPDGRLDSLCALYPDRIRKPAHINFIDLAGMAFGDIKNEAYLSHLRRADGLTHVVRGFHDEAIPHFRDRIDPDKDIRSMAEEMILADLMVLESRVEKLEKELKRAKTPDLEKEIALLIHIRGRLEENVPLSELSLAETEDKLLRSFAFLSRKPLLHMINIDEADIPRMASLRRDQAPLDSRTRIMTFCGKIESEIQQLDDEEKSLFMKEYGLDELSDARFLRAAYELMNVETFFTIGKDEVKAWTVARGTSAWEAAGNIHSDIQRGFIRAEVIAWDRLQDFGSFQAAREKAAVRLEGKSYTVQDGDVIFFRFAS